MEPTYYPFSAHLLEDILKPICSEHGGITRSLLVSPVKYADDLDIKSVVAQMPAYHKVLLNPLLEMQYHLSGYGVFHEEALVRLAGEAIERYALLVSQVTLAGRIEYATYSDIEGERGAVPFEWLRLFSEADCEKLARSQYRGMKRLERDDVVGWIRCPSLFDPTREIWIPAQMLFVGYRLNRARNEVAFSPGFSTGTAAHRSVERALQSALLEFIEIDALMIHWYAALKAPRVTVDDLTVARLLPRLHEADSRYEVVPLLLNLLEGVDAHVLASVLINRRGERPYIVLGAQGHLDPVRAYYRSLMEAVAIAFLGIYGPVFLPDKYMATRSAEEAFDDLDANVAFFASPDRAAEKRATIDRLIGERTVLSGLPSHDSGDAKADTARLIRQLSRHSEYGVYLDITPPETAGRGWRVMRVFVPELVTMCVPGVPYGEHPRLRAHGGIRNGFPHPLP
ncbi:MAG: YcaO-like family protein [Verrucomicrobiae bacterium]|nr:YcaO-like family protein [Verrucomicrobiae bacterium]